MARRNTVGVLVLAWALAGAAGAQELRLQNALATVSIAPYSTQAALGGRVQLDAGIADLDTSLSLAMERAGLAETGRDAWTPPASPAWSGDMRLGVDWAMAPSAKLTLEAAQQQRWTRTPATVGGGASQLTSDGERSVRLRAALTGAKLNLDLGAEAAASVLDTRTMTDGLAGSSTQLLGGSRRLFADLTWRPWSRVSVQATQAVQSLTVGWRADDQRSATAAALTPSLALAATPWRGATWRLEAQKTLTPIDPGQFAAYAQVATAQARTAPQPDRGWRYGLRVEQSLPGGVTFAAEANQWRLASVTDLGPVGDSEAPVNIGAGARQQLALNLAAPLAPIGFSGATVDAQLKIKRSRVIDPFTGQPRAISGEAPYGAQVRLAGALPVSNLIWSVTARADGPQSLYQRTQVTSLSATSGVGGALTYGLAGVKMSLEFDNLLGGSRDVTTYSYYSGDRSGDRMSGISRRQDDARAVRFALHQPL